MATAEAPTQDPLLSADACGNHKGELERVQLQQKVLQRVLAAQNKLNAIRGEYATVHSLFWEINELKADETLLRAQRNFLDALIDQQERLDGLATSLVRLLN